MESDARILSQSQSIGGTATQHEFAVTSVGASFDDGNPQSAQALRVDQLMGGDGNLNAQLSTQSTEQGAEQERVQRNPQESSKPPFNHIAMVHGIDEFRTVSTYVAELSEKRI